MLPPCYANVTVILTSSYRNDPFVHYAIRASVAPAEDDRGFMEPAFVLPASPLRRITFIGKSFGGTLPAELSGCIQFFSRHGYGTVTN